MWWWLWPWCCCQPVVSLPVVVGIGTWQLLVAPDFLRSPANTTTKLTQRYAIDSKRTLRSIHIVLHLKQTSLRPLSPEAALAASPTSARCSPAHRAIVRLHRTYSKSSTQRRQTRRDLLSIPYLTHFTLPPAQSNTLERTWDGLQYHATGPAEHVQTRRHCCKRFCGQPTAL
jgi:hypothetical protein